MFNYLLPPISEVPSRLIPTRDPLLELLLLLLLDAPEDVDDALGLTGTPRELTVSDADRLKRGRRRLLSQGNTKGGSIIVPLTSCLTGLD